MKVKNEIKIYDRNGKDLTIDDETKLEVTNVWNRPRFVKLNITGQDTVIVFSDDLLKAISNATGNAD